MLNRQQRQHVSNMEGVDKQSVERVIGISFHLLY